MVAAPGVAVANELIELLFFCNNLQVPTPCFKQLFHLLVRHHRNIIAPIFNERVYFLWQSLGWLSTESIYGSCPDCVLAQLGSFLSLVVDLRLGATYSPAAKVQAFFRVEPLLIIFVGGIEFFILLVLALV